MPPDICRPPDTLCHRLLGGSGGSCPGTTMIRLALGCQVRLGKLSASQNGRQGGQRLPG
jgi:hypothetical protein